MAAGAQGGAARRRAAARLATQLRVRRVAVAGGLTLPLIGGLLGHRQPQTTARYAHLAADPLKAAAELVGSRIVAAMAGGAKANVVMPLKR